MSNASHFDLAYKPLGEAALLIEWPAEISEPILNDVLALQQEVERTLRNYIIETVNAYQSLTLIFNPDLISFEALTQKVSDLYKNQKRVTAKKSLLWKIPVCYDKTFGIDLDEISKTKKISVDEIVAKHSETIYTVYFIGFLPGFLYLGGLLPELHVPRKSVPRLKINRGAVAIGGSQTGIYPVESPGGWNIIGNTPLHFFDADKNPPCFANPGDKLTFYPIDKDTHYEISQAVENNRFVPEKESL